MERSGIRATKEIQEMRVRRKSAKARVNPRRITGTQSYFDAPGEAQRHAAEAIKTLVAWMRSGDARISIAACHALLDRSHGKPGRAEAPEGPRPLTHEEWLAVLD
jgi:hypothetical protein